MKSVEKESSIFLRDKIVKIDISKIKEYEKNNKNHPESQIALLMQNIRTFGFTTPLLIDENNVIIAGHGRKKAAEQLGMKELPCIKITDLSENQIKALRIADNKVTELAETNFEFLQEEWLSLKEDGSGLEFLTGWNEEDFSFLEESKEVVEDDFDVPDDVEEIKTDIKQGDVILLGKHRLMCGDSTKEEDVNKLMDGNKAVLGHNDPPYGMKKENEGVLNDNLNYNDLLEFNKKWISLQFKYLEDNGSFYCWGIDEPLMNIYSSILEPLIKEQKATFRNLITWNKGNGQGQMSEDFRSYPIADEKCLFVMCGVQGFNTNADNYFEGWEPIRDYLLKSRLEMGWDVPTMKKIVGHSDLFRDHWTSKSQFNMPTREVYNKMKAEADRLRSKTNNDAFKKEYDELKKEYDELKKEYDELKKEYYSTRAYFNNTHDNMNNVWNISRTNNTERESVGNHATPKPLELCSRVIKSSSRENDLVVDVFGGSGSTLVACEQLNRVCYMMELDERYCEVICQRWEKLTGKTREWVK
jgi:DNA modification methylase